MSVVFVVSVVALTLTVLRMSEYRQKAMYMISLKAYTKETTQTTETAAEGSSVTYVTNNLDFDRIKEANSDIYAWIEVPGTDVDYPVLQSTLSDDYYLGHNMDGSKGYPGCIYSESINSRLFTDKNTVLYGHDMKNGTMFASLHRFEDSDFFRENQYIYIYVQDGRTLVYRIFAAYRTDATHQLKGYDITTDDGFSAYINGIYAHDGSSDNFDTGVRVDSGSRILTLSTCNSDYKGRYLVQGVLVEG
jgi:sortase B